MKQNTKIVLSVVAVLLLAVAVLAWLNQDSVAEKKALLERGGFRITANGQDYTVTMEDIQAIGPRVIDANYKKDGKAPIPKQYTGVPLKSLFDYLKIDYSAAKTVSFTAADGYASALPLNEALDAENCFIVFEEEGEPLNKKEYGPYMMILAKDQFSQRWCKFLLEVAVS